MELGEILYLTIPREAKSLEIAASDDLLAFGFICKCLAEDAEDLKKCASLILILDSDHRSLLAPQSGALRISAYRDFQSHPSYHL